MRGLSLKRSGVRRICERLGSIRSSLKSGRIRRAGYGNCGQQSAELSIRVEGSSGGSSRSSSGLESRRIGRVRRNSSRQSSSCSCNSSIRGVAGSGRSVSRGLSRRHSSIRLGKFAGGRGRVVGLVRLVDFENEVILGKRVDANVAIDDVIFRAADAVGARQRQVGVCHEQLGERVLLERDEQVLALRAGQVVEAVTVLQVLQLHLEDGVEG